MRVKGRELNPILRVVQNNLGLIKVDNFKTLQHLWWSLFAIYEHFTEVSIPQKDSKEQLAVQVALNSVFANLVCELLGFVRVADFLFDVQVGVEAVFVLGNR